MAYRTEDIIKALEVSHGMIYIAALVAVLIAGIAVEDAGEKSSGGGVG